jgi:hypothetical protein
MMAIAITLGSRTLHSFLSPRGFLLSFCLGASSSHSPQPRLTCAVTLVPFEQKTCSSVMGIVTVSSSTSSFQRGLLFFAFRFLDLCFSLCFLR